MLPVEDMPRVKARAVLLAADILGAVKQLAARLAAPRKPYFRDSPRFTR
jgi:hypothetical protein